MNGPPGTAARVGFSSALPRLASKLLASFDFPKARFIIGIESAHYFGYCHPSLRSDGFQAPANWVCGAGDLLLLGDSKADPPRKGRARDDSLIELGDRYPSSLITKPGKRSRLPFAVPLCS